MAYTDFYVLLNKYTRGAMTLCLNINADFYKLFKSEFIPEYVVECTPCLGSKAYDFLDSGYAGLNLVSKKVIELFESNAISGWSSIPVRINGYEGSDYYILTVTGRCSEIDYGKSEPFIMAPFTPTGRPFEAKIGLYFDLNSWDGSDVFTPEKSTFMFVTEKVKKLLVKNKVTNIIIENITKYEQI
jgi:hypothetical protein